LLSSIPVTPPVLPTKFCAGGGFVESRAAPHKIGKGILHALGSSLSEDTAMVAKVIFFVKPVLWIGTQKNGLSHIRRKEKLHEPTLRARMKVNVWF
jgi:hypothetical protein